MSAIVCFQEHELEQRLHEQIVELRNDAFPDCRHDRSYHKQLPHFRLLYMDDGVVAGHLGVDHRMIRVGETPASIFGVVDLCVHKNMRKRGIGTQLLDRAHDMAVKAEIDFLFLIASDHRLYSKNGFTAVDGICSWLRIDEHRNYGVAVEEITGEMMIKPTGSKEWPSGPIDLLGYMF